MSKGHGLSHCTYNYKLPKEFNARLWLPFPNSSSHPKAFLCVWSFVDGGVKGQSFHSELSTPIYFQVAGFCVMNTPRGIGWYKMAKNKVTRISVVTISLLFLREIYTTQPVQETVTDNCRSRFHFEISLEVIYMFSEKSYWHFHILHHI